MERSALIAAGAVLLGTNTSNDRTSANVEWDSRATACAVRTDLRC